MVAGPSFHFRRIRVSERYPVSDTIRVRGARQHNLQGVDLDLPKGCLIAFTGVSGSGKSSLAFDTLYAEGQRRYVESLSNYARQFLANLPRPDVDEIEGLAPTIAIDQAARSHNPRSTVATITEIYDHLRVLYAAIGVPHCPQCGLTIGSQTRAAIVGQILALPAKQATVLAPVARRQKGEFLDLFDDMMRRGYARARVDGEIFPLDNPPVLDRQRFHDIEVVMDRISIAPKARARIAEAVEQALELSEGTVVVAREGEPDLMLSSEFACAACGLSFEEPTHQHFSFNSPKGMCPDCEGLGERRDFVPELLVPDPSKSLLDGAVPLMKPLSNLRWRHWVQGVADHYGFDLDTPWADLTEEQTQRLLQGSDGKLIEFYFKHPRWSWEWRHADAWEGLAPHLMRRYKTLRSRILRRQLEDAMRIQRCSTCGGKRLQPYSLGVTVGGASVSEITAMTVGDARDFFDALKLSNADEIVADDALKEVRARLAFLADVGLHYLSLDRTAPTLSGGEAQRIRLASQVGSGLVDVLYILDEPSIGLHHRDQGQLLKTLEYLRDLGNTIIVVEHDEQTIRAADYVVDFGPGAGQRGGEVVARGSVRGLMRSAASLTGQYLSGRREISVPERRRNGNGAKLVLRGASHNNLRGIDVQFPLGRLICVTGVSGSGKSSLVTDTLHPALASQLQGAQAQPGEHDGIDGLEALEKVVLIDQDPIGRTPRSNPATYVGVFDRIRTLYASLPEARQRGYKPGRFSFNVREGRCPACEGNGAIRLESDFLADVWVQCETCAGKRFDEETLTVRYRERTIAEVLEMEVGEALEHFANQPKIRTMLQMMADVGLGYLKLGQPATTLSGGEAQRVKLAEELCRPRRGKSLYILDEPTTGLHFEDVRHLLSVLQRFVDEGNTVVVVEHHPDIVKCADWVIDLGPEGGAKGGRVVAAGTPEYVARRKTSHTGTMLREVFDGHPGEAIDVKPARRTRLFDRGDIEVHGGREHNLRGVDVKIPRRKLTVISGVSGSGKTSLALDTIYAEGQRRYVESLSSYARQFVSQMEKPKVDRVSGLPPAIAIDQKRPSHNPRSTVGTVTTIYDYMRVLFARLATPHCTECGAEIGSRTVAQIVDEMIVAHADQTALLLAPVTPRGNEQYADFLAWLHRQGWLRVRIDGEVEQLPLQRNIDRRRQHQIEVVVDRVQMSARHRSRLAEAVESALELSGGTVTVAPMDDGGAERAWSRHFSCDQCGASFEPLTPRGFSFNHRDGWCPVCEGLGYRRGADPRALVPDPEKSIRGGALSPWGELPDGSLLHRMLAAVARDTGFDLDTPFSQLTAEHQDVIFYGAGDREFEVDEALSARFLGLIPSVEEASRLSHHFRRKVGRVVRNLPCSACKGGRVKPQAAASLLRGRSIIDICTVPLGEALGFFEALEITDRERAMGADILDEIRRRLGLLLNVGLGYLDLHRSAPTLSGGESQRVRLAGQIGSGLTGVLYVLDEPTVGVHPADNEKTLAALANLRDMGNTALVVEHDEQTLRAADYLIDLGPGSGPGGGQVVAAGTVAAVSRSRRSLTGQLLAGTLAVPVPLHRRPVPARPRNGGADGFISILGAAHNNLREIDVHIPLGVLTVVTGPSGSGKSSLINDILYPELAYALHGAQTVGGLHRRVAGVEQVDGVINIDQASIGQTPRSGPATYTGLFDLVRELFAMLPEARLRGYGVDRFSFNRRGGRCEACDGMGRRHVEMHFLPDVWLECEECSGQRYNRETLEVKYRGKSIAQVLEMTVGEALVHFDSFPRIRHILQTLADVGLDYLPLGQSAPMLSGGEAQRVKLARELARPSRGRTIYLLDEPTTGLHRADVIKLLEVLGRLVEAGNTVVIIEHNLDVIKSADWLIDLGPGSGDAGGRLVSAGAPERVAQSKRSATAPFLRAALEASERRELVFKQVTGPPRGKADREALAALAADVERPWESDGEAWHLGPTTPVGDERQWEPGTLRTFIDAVGAASGHKPTWADRQHVTFPGAGGKDWWARARTDYVWDVRLQLRTGKGRFDQDDLADRFALPTWNEIDGLPHYGSGSRVRVRTRGRSFDTITIWGFYQHELDTDEFRRFVRECWESYHEATDGEGG